MEEIKYLGERKIRHFFVEHNGEEYYVNLSMEQIEARGTEPYPMPIYRVVILTKNMELFQDLQIDMETATNKEKALVDTLLLDGVDEQINRLSCRLLLEFVINRGNIWIG